LVPACLLRCISGRGYYKPDDLDRHRFKRSRSAFVLAALCVIPGLSLVPISDESKFQARQQPGESKEPQVPWRVQGSALPGPGRARRGLTVRRTGKAPSKGAAAIGRIQGTSGSLAGAGQRPAGSGQSPAWPDPLTEQEKTAEECGNAPSEAKSVSDGAFCTGATHARSIKATAETEETLIKSRIRGDMRRGIRPFCTKILARRCGAQEPHPIFLQ